MQTVISNSHGTNNWDSKKILNYKYTRETPALGGISLALRRSGAHFDLDRPKMISILLGDTC